MLRRVVGVVRNINIGQGDSMITKVQRLQVGTGMGAPTPTTGNLCLKSLAGPLQSTTIPRVEVAFSKTSIDIVLCMRTYCKEVAAARPRTLQIILLHIDS